MREAATSIEMAAVVIALGVFLVCAIYFVWCWVREDAQARRSQHDPPEEP